MRIEETTCTGKIAHETFADAKRRLKVVYRTGQHGKLSGQKIDIYKCPHCYKWHIGKTISPHSVTPRAKPYKRNKLRY